MSRRQWLWFLLGGWFIWLNYLIAGILFSLSLVAIPYGLKCFKLSWLGLTDFERDIGDRPPPLRRGFTDEVMTIIWLMPLGILVLSAHILLAAIFTVSVVGRPFAMRHAKLVIVCLQPFIKELK